jgi:hypothetical protein
MVAEIWRSFRCMIDRSTRSFSTFAHADIIWKDAVPTGTHWKSQGLPALFLPFSVVDDEIASQIPLDVSNLGIWLWARAWRGNLRLGPCAQYLRRNFITRNPFVALGVVVFETIIVCVSSYASDGFCLGVLDVASFFVMGTASFVVASGVTVLLSVVELDFFEDCVTAATASPSSSHLEVAVGYGKVLR